MDSSRQAGFACASRRLAVILIAGFIAGTVARQSLADAAPTPCKLWHLLSCRSASERKESQSPGKILKGKKSLAGLSLAALGNIKVTTVSKEPEEVWRTPDAVYVLTQEDIRRSGATTIPDILRLVPGVEVAQIDSDQWAVGVRGFGGQFSQSLLVLIDGRSVYTPL
ncbi:MAG TPA: Plug domain-containing protein, partial [Terriglobia bacterium]|nr:Plug domain-containing protein [Terriglobia bacterium]